MPKNKAPGKPSGGKAGRGGGSSISKPDRGPSKLAQALAQGRAASSGTAKASLHFVAWTAEETASVDRLASLVCESLQQAPGGRLSLSALGSSFSELAKRRGLHGSDNKLQSLSHAVKAQWGSWEGFVRARAADGLRLEGEVLICEPAEEMMRGDDGSPAAGPTSRPPLPAKVPSRDDVNGLTLDAL